MTQQLATLCYVRDRNKRSVLMLERATRPGDVHSGKWNGLGGKFERGESPEQCVQREVKEESGLDIIMPKLAGFLTFPNFSHGKDWYVFVFTAEQYVGSLTPSNEGKLHWVKEEELLNLNVWEGDKLFLPYVIENVFFSGIFHYKDGSLVDHSLSFHKHISE